MLLRFRAGSLFALGGGLLAFGSCTGVADDQPTIAARPGGTQPGGKGSLIGEDEACQRVQAAENKVRQHLNCPDLGRADCPDYIRVAGGGCWVYPEGAVSACEDAIARYASCADFDDRPCIVTAQATDPAECSGPVGTGGAGGEGGESSGGEAPVAGRGGSAGGGGSAGTAPSVGGEGGQAGGSGAGGEAGR